MTKQFEAKVALVSGRNPGISLAIDGSIDAAYDARKLGVIGQAREVAFKYTTAKYTAPQLGSNAVRPAIIETSMVQDTVLGNEGLGAQLMARHPPGPFGQAEEVAAITLQLRSPGAAFGTGQAPAFDGVD